MNTRQKVLLTLAMITLSGCAEVVKKNYTASRGGIVRYSTAWFMADKNREKAVEEMKAFCAPQRPILTSEEKRKESTGHSYSNSEISGNRQNTTTTQGSEGYIYMRFQCRKS